MLKSFPLGLGTAAGLIQYALNGLQFGVRNEPLSPAQVLHGSDHTNRLKFLQVWVVQTSQNLHISERNLPKKNAHFCSRLRL